MTETMILGIGVLVVLLWWFIAWQLSKDEAELPLFGPDDDRPLWKEEDERRLVTEFRQRLTRHERLQRMADRGCDTWEEYRGKR